MTDLERLARAFVVPLGHDPAKDWARVYVGNGFEADGSLKALCHELARAALAAMRVPSYAMLNEGGVAMTKTWTDPWDELGPEMTELLALPDAPSAVSLEARTHVAPHVKATWQAMIDAALEGEQ